MSAGDAGRAAYKLARCEGLHYFHAPCITTQLASHKPKCPVCGVLFAPVRGDQPENGTMTVEQKAVGVKPLAGYEEEGTIVITYELPSGVQDACHPRPGQPYQGTKRIAYLPNSERGRRALERLQVAWQQRQVFTVGDSLTTGTQGVVCWAGIHHKTRVSGGAAQHGFPDPGYLDRLGEELAARGIA
jgi:deltex-like protein